MKYFTGLVNAAWYPGNNIYYIPPGILEVDGSYYQAQVVVWNGYVWSGWNWGNFVLGIPGACGTANGACGSGLSFCSATTINSSTPGLCAAGTPSITHATKEWSWNCLGQNGGSDANNCSAGTLPNPGCATKQICSGSSFSSCDSSFCTGGANCALTGGTTWTCTNSCASVSCNAFVIPRVDGECGNWNGCTNTSGTYCEKGTRIDFVEGSYESTWKCQGECGGATPSCSARGPKACGWIETNP